MPLVRISLVKGKPAELRRAIGGVVHNALVEAFGVPEQDRFQVLTEHEAGDLIYDADYLGIARTGNIVLVQLTVSAGRTLAQKRALYRKIADGLAALGLRREDAWINLIEVAKENWSFGNGVASYAPAATVAA